MLTFRIVENILGDNSSTYDVLISDAHGSTLRLHATTEGAAIVLCEALRAHIREHTVDLTESLPRASQSAA
jgi:hypothetical protein